MELVTFGERLIVEIPEVEELSPSGLVIPDSAKELPTRGTIVTVGEKVTLEAGDTVIFPPNAGIPIPGHEGFRLFDLSQIIAVERG